MLEILENQSGLNYILKTKISLMVLFSCIFREKIKKKISFNSSFNKKRWIYKFTILAKIFNWLEFNFHVAPPALLTKCRDFLYESGRYFLNEFFTYFILKNVMKTFGDMLFFGDNGLKPQWKKDEKWIFPTFYILQYLIDFLIRNNPIC